MPTDYKRQMKSVGAMASAYLEELLNNDPYEPKCIYNTLKHIGMIKNDAQRGHQEDAEEFLSSVLNGLHEEMIQLSKLLNDYEMDTKKSQANNANGFGVNDLPDNDGLFVDDDNDVSDENMWHEVGTSKHKSLPTRSVRLIQLFFNLKTCLIFSMIVSAQRPRLFQLQLPKSLVDQFLTFVLLIRITIREADNHFLHFN